MKLACESLISKRGSIFEILLKIWSEYVLAGRLICNWKTKSDPFSMYQTLTQGIGAMPAQLKMTPREKYDVIHYIRNEFVQQDEREPFLLTAEYLKGLPKGANHGPVSKPYHPWSDQNYGNFLINTYELVDEKNGIKRFHSPGPSPFPAHNDRRRARPALRRCSSSAATSCPRADRAAYRDSCARRSPRRSSGSCFWAF